MRGSLLFALVLSAALASETVDAEVEKIASVCDKGICPHWWPKLTPPLGWQQDRDHSLHYNFNALVPNGKSFANAETVMYANAVYKPRMPESASLSSFVANDQASFLSEVPDLVIRPGTELKTRDGKSAVTWFLEPKSAGQWERIAYFEETDYYMVFVISSRTGMGLQEAMPSFEILVSTYRE